MYVHKSGNITEILLETWFNNKTYRQYVDHSVQPLFRAYSDMSLREWKEYKREVANDINVCTQYKIYFTYCFRN